MFKRYKNYKSHYLCTILSLGLFGVGIHQEATGQHTVKALINNLEQIDLHKKWKTQITPHSITYILRDTLVFCPYPVNPIRRDGIPQLRTYKLMLTLEANWDKAKIEQVKSQNAPRLTILKRRIIAYCDSIQWKAMTNEYWINERLLDFVYIVKNWTSQEKALIAQVKRIPNFIYKGIGIFADLNTICLIPDEKQKMLDNLFSKLKVFGIRSELLGWHNEKY